MGNMLSLLKSGDRIPLRKGIVDNGLGLYDFRARMYGPALGRFTSVDPLAERYPGISPYSYCAGNPVNFVDPDGRII